MRLAQRLRLAALDFWLRLVRPRTPTREEVARQHFSTHPGGKGLRFTGRLREALRRTS